MILDNFIHLINCPVFIDIKQNFAKTKQNLLPYVYFRFLGLVKFYSGCFRQASFHLGNKKKWSLVAFDRWLSYTVTIVWEFSLADSVLVVLDEW